jgi:hypothetical protein
MKLFTFTLIKSSLYDEDEKYYVSGKDIAEAAAKASAFVEEANALNSQAGLQIEDIRLVGLHFIG